MADGGLEFAEFQRYAQLLKALSPADISLSVYDLDARLLWDDGAFTAKTDQALLAWMRSRARGDTGLRSIRFSGNKYFYTIPIVDPQGLPVVMLMFATRLWGVLFDDPEKTIDDGIRLIAECISRDYRTTLEANDLADELAERYEELNLVYEAEEKTGNRASGQDAMQSLISDYIDYLNVDMAIFAVPEKRICVFDVNESSRTDDQQQILTAVRGIMYEWLKIHKRPLVLNKPDDKTRSEICPDIMHKLVATPVDVGGEYPIGILVILNHPAKPDFRNSDRNLLNVISKKLAKVIMASYDSLTGLENLTCFENSLKQSLSSALTMGVTHTVLNIDIDQLQIVNDIFGRKSGDALIKGVGRQIQENIRGGDIVARTGGDEFCVLLENCSLEVAQRIARKIQDQMAAWPFNVEGKTHEVSVTVGLAPVSAEAESYADILTAVEMARNAAKERGRNKLQVFGLEDMELLRRKVEMKWVNKIQSAIRDDRFQLYGQLINPICSDHQGIHYEVLLRLTDERGDHLAPGAFMPAAEHYYLMPAIDRWVIDQTFAEIQYLWPRMANKDITLSINLSGQSISDDGFRSYLMDRLRSTDIPPGVFCFEITETAAIANLSEAQDLIAKIKAQGSAVSLDDFGSGLSSFSYLKNLDVDFLKIDGSFVRDITSDQVSRSMVAAFNQIGKAMRLTTICEWVENEQVTDILRTIGVDYGQGFYFGRPAPLHEQLSGCCAADTKVLGSAAS